eukprot:1281768-Prorocentrum_lima.AAC.1
MCIRDRSSPCENPRNARRRGGAVNMLLSGNLIPEKVVRKRYCKKRVLRATRHLYALVSGTHWRVPGLV